MCSLRPTVDPDFMMPLVTQCMPRASIVQLASRGARMRAGGVRHRAMHFKRSFRLALIVALQHSLHQATMEAETAQRVAMWISLHQRPVRLGAVGRVLQARNECMQVLQQRKLLGQVGEEVCRLFSRLRHTKAL